MAKVSLRIYNREIEGLIDQGHLDEAVAHCHHILKTFPKHLETYRMLGKAHLESKRYEEAVDIFSRVLMAVPDDFVAHVGMSIVRDEQGKLDDAIWHMERAFEAQPSNAAIQGELQRLYGRRDGMEPPKIRMTRGALAHMYVQGELYSQAVAEISAVLAEDPNRSDMKVLLARSYFRSNQKADASDMCSQLLKQYPYCFDANRIMVELLPSAAGAAESTQVYRTRVIELDPYAGLAKGSMFQSNEVADAAVNLERLEYTGDQVPMGQEWGASLGIGLAASSVTAPNPSDQPDWLKSEAPSQFQPSVETQNAAQTNDDIPDFLRAAGWAESKTPEQPTSIFDQDPAGSNDLIPADLPDWLKGQVPVAGVDKPAEPQYGSEQSIQTPDWLTGLSNEQPASPSNSAQAEPAPIKDTPDWLNVQSEASSQPGDVPDWLSGLSTSQAVKPAPTQSADVPDWLSGLDNPQTSEPSPAQSTNISDLFSTPSSEPVSNQDNTLPDWLDGLDELQPLQPITPASISPSIENLGASSQEQDDAVAWLESLAAKHGAKPEEMVTDPNKRSDTPPDWVQQAQAAGEAESAVNLARGENKQSVGDQFLADFANASAAPATDETGMWLRNLDEKEKQDVSVTPPAREASELPDWVNELKPKSEPPEEQNLHPVEIPEWMKDAQQPIDSVNQFDFAEKEEPTTKGSDLPNWLSGVEEGSSAKINLSENNLEDQDLSNWLSNLDNEPGLPFEAMPTPDSIMAATTSASNIKDEPVAAKSDLPDWLSDVDSTGKEDLEEDLWQKSIGQESTSPASLPTQEPETISLTADLPDWLKSVEEEAAPLEGVEGDDVPPWMHREKWEADELQPLQPTSASDWHPVEERASPPVLEPVFEQDGAVLHEPVEASPSPAFIPDESEQPVPARKKSGLRVRLPQPEAQDIETVLNQAKGELDRGDIPTALGHYGKLIKKGKNLEQTIRDLSESLYRYPVEVGIWQTLGDAYMRSNRLKEALEAYNKAEELIR